MDVTEKFAKQIKKRIETGNKRRAEEKKKGVSNNSTHEFLPFSEDKRPLFEFKRADDTAIDGRAVFTIEVIAKKKDDQLFEGQFYIDQLTHEVLKAKIKPSKNPKSVKELDMELDFETLPGGKFYMKKIRTRTNASLLFKHFRVITEDAFSDVKILDSNVKQPPTQLYFVDGSFV